MAKEILCLRCHNVQESNIYFSEISKDGICKTCFEGIFAYVFKDFSWKQKLGFFFRRLFHFKTKMPFWSDYDEYIPPVKRLIDAIFLDLLRHNGTKIRFVYEKGTEEHSPDSNEPTDRFSVSYFVQNEWQEWMRPPSKLFSALMSRLKLMANLPTNEQTPCRGKIFFRKAAYLVIAESMLGFSPTEELFLIDFQTSLDPEKGIVIVELTLVPSQHATSSTAA